MAVYLSSCSLVGEVTLARQVEQHRITITNILTRRRRFPLSLGVATNDISILDLKQGDCRPLLVTSRVEVFTVPPVFWPSIEHVSNEPLVAEQFKQVFLMFILSGTFREFQEAVNQCNYLIVTQFGLSNGLSGLRLGVRGFRLRERDRGFNLSGRILKLSLRYIILRLCASIRIWRFRLMDRFL